MFINPKVFKRLCQQAWKNQSLHIEHIERPEASWYMIRSDWWQAKNISRQTESRMARLLYHIKPKCELIFPKEETLWMMYSTS